MSSPISISKVYFTRYSFDGLSSNSTFDDIEAILLKIENKFLEYERSNNVVIECPMELLDFKENGLSLDDILFDAAHDDLSKYQFYLDMFEKQITPHVGYIETNEILASISTQNYDFPRLYAYILKDTLRWPNIDMSLYTYSWSHTLTLNSEFIAKNHKDKDEFFKLSKEHYEYIDFSDTSKDTLDTIIVGDYTDYKYLLSQALNTLNQAYHLISTDPEKNIDDLDIIAGHSAVIGNLGQTGKTLMCTRQAATKVYADFKKIDGTIGTETINCEYHLKIKWNDRGTPIPRGEGKPVRVYFGLKSYEKELGLERKKLKLAHMGKHL